jgi:hypothetical protein
MALGVPSNQEVAVGRSHRFFALAVVVVVGAASVGGCTADPGPTPSPTTASTSAPATGTPSASASTPATTAGPSPSLPAGFGVADVTSPRFPDLGGDLGGAGIVRVGRQTGFDRVVWEFTGTGTPTYRVRYVDVPTADGSGDPVAVAGDAFIEVVITSVGIPEEGAARPADPPASALEGTVIAEANAIFGGFEGYGQSFIGVRDRQRPFKVSLLTGPTRLVVDVATG